MNGDLNERLTDVIHKLEQQRLRAQRIAAASRAENLVACAWCGHYRAAEQWGELPWRLTPSQRRLLSHGICDACFEREVGQPPGTRG